MAIPGELVNNDQYAVSILRTRQSLVEVHRDEFPNF
jgi:hypothetical protein